jgi:serine/threonine protein kinase
MILRTIGRGGMGAVYQARDMKRQGAICAIKEMSLSMVAPEERDQAIQNFKIEAKILWGLNHPNLPAFTGFFSENQRYFLVMEYIDGMTLEELLERNKGPFSERRVLGWARQLCDVLEYLHSQNPPIIFRDMKPGNIMLTRSGHIKLIDFGIARFFRPSSKQDTQHLGTPGFAPPEQYGTSQTDERSDIYSLAMTLFQLLTDTFSEHGFGLQNIRAINPRISPVVARALEKAADMRPEGRYKNVAEFRSALLGVGFVFDSGDLAMDPRELAELCVRYPAEAADYLIAGEVEAWLHEVGQESLAREALRIRTMIDDPQDAIESFIQITIGQHALVHGKSTRKNAHGSQNGVRKAVPADLTNLKPSKPPHPVQVNPPGLDFGSIFTRNISDAHTLTISGNEGLLVSGIVYSNDSWIMLDQTSFDGVATHINVRINSSKLYSPAHYTGTIMIVPDPDNAQKDIIVPVEVDIIDPQIPNAALKPLRKAKTANADLDADDEDDEFDAITLGGPIPQQQMQQIMHGMADDQDKTIPMAPDKDSEYRAKFGPPNAQSGSGGWELLKMSLQQSLMLQRAMTFVAAFMLASLVYNLTARALPPNPLCIIVLAGMIPASTLGALVVNWDHGWPMKEKLNRFCTGMASVLPVLALLNIILLIFKLPIPPQAYLVLMLLAAATSATVGIAHTISDRIIDGIVWMLLNLNWRYSIIGLSAVGGILGYLLTVGFALSPFTLIGTVLGVGVGLALGEQVKSLLKTNQP